jgi:hypothetical protein
VEYALYPGTVVDRRVDRHRVTLGRTSVKIRESHTMLTARRCQGIEFPGREWYVFSDGMLGSANETILLLPEYWNLVHLHLA